MPPSVRRQMTDAERAGMRTASQVDRREMPIDRRLNAIDDILDEHSRAMAEWVNGEQLRNDAAKRELDESLAAAKAIFDPANAATNAKLDQLLADSKESAAEREKRKKRDEVLAERKMSAVRKYRLGLLVAVVPIVLFLLSLAAGFLHIRTDDVPRAPESQHRPE